MIALISLVVTIVLVASDTFPYWEVITATARICQSLSREEWHISCWLITYSLTYIILNLHILLSLIVNNKVGLSD